MGEDVISRKNAWQLGIARLRPRSKVLVRDKLYESMFVLRSTSAGLIGAC